MFLKELVGDLQKDTYTVTGLSLSILTCAMFQILYDPQSILHNCMTFLSLDVDYCTDTAVVMFKLFPVQTLLHSFSLLNLVT